VKISDHWRRHEPTFYNFLALERRAQDAPDALAGMRGALMSRDAHSGALSYLIELPPGWRARTDAEKASLEFFVLRGRLALEGAAAASGGYVHLPQLCGGGELSSDRGALALAFWNPNLPCYPYPVTRNRVVNSWMLDWTNSMPGAHGVMHKSLRLPDPVPHPLDEGFDGGPGGYLRFQYIAPQMIAEMEHVHHECWEEIVVLQGDVMLLNEGQMGIGSVVSHPQEWYHAPFVSRSGAVILVHTDAPMGYPWPPRPYPNGRALCEAYLADAPWDEPTEHRDWSEHPLAAVQDADPQYRAWRASPAGARWGGAEKTERVPARPGGRGTASAFRASWKRGPSG
jgi:hypothetical protein